jgi:DNA invertase Pin-like site-specific DNA recombinase
LLVAKLDRLSRDIIDIFTLKKDTALTFEVCDIDASDTMTLGIFATLAQKERELISKRTREALAAKKADGIKLGNPNITNRTKAGLDQSRKAGRASAEARKDAAYKNDANRKAFAAIQGREGSLQELADYLNNAGFSTSTGKPFGKMQVKRLLDRYAPLHNLL